MSYKVNQLTFEVNSRTHTWMSILQYNIISVRSTTWLLPKRSQSEAITTFCEYVTEHIQYIIGQNHIVIVQIQDVMGEFHVDVICICPYILLWCGQNQILE